MPRENTNWRGLTPKILVGIAAVILFSFSSFGQTSSFDGTTFSFNLTSVDNDDSKTAFRTGEAILIKPKIENGSNEIFPISVRDTYYLFKFTLTKGIEVLPVPYRADKSRTLSIREEDPGASSVLLLDPIFPGETHKLPTMKISDRYENLTAGNYKLLIEYKTDKIIQVNGTSKKLRLTYEVDFAITP